MGRWDSAWTMGAATEVGSLRADEGGTIQDRAGLQLEAHLSSWKGTGVRAPVHRAQGWPGRQTSSGAPEHPACSLPVASMPAWKEGTNARAHPQLRGDTSVL